MQDRVTIIVLILSSFLSHARLRTVTYSTIFTNFDFENKTTLLIIIVSIDTAMELRKQKLTDPQIGMDRQLGTQVGFFLPSVSLA